MTPPRCLMTMPPDRRQCPAPACSPAGLCRGCLSAAAAEYARLSGPRSVESGGSPASVSSRDLCTRCGSWRHSVAECPTWADIRKPERGRAA